MSEEKKSYFAIIPANVRYDKSITPNAKLLYGEITALCNEKGYCWASNNYFADLYEVTPQAVSKWINQLAKKGYITLDYERAGKEIKQRNIYIATYQQIIKEVSTKDDVGINKRLRGYQQKIKENTTVNNTSNNTSNKETQDKPAPSKKIVKPKDSEIKEYAAVPKIGHTKESNINKLSKEIYEEIEKAYESCFYEVKPSGKLFIDYPRIRKRTKELLERITKDEIISVIQNAKTDDWIKDNGFQFSTILSDFQVAKLLNGKPEGRRGYSKPLPVQTRTTFLDMED